MLTLEDAIRDWEETGRHGSRVDRIERGKKWIPYYAFLAQAQNTDNFTLPKQPNELIAALFADGAVKPGDTVLDIGAGMGNYVLEFARQGCHVTALDTSRDCLEILRKRAEKCGLSNRIETVLEPWETFSPAKAFDVTFSSMCPAICNMEELERMEAMTNRTCCLISVSRGSCDKHRRAMMAALEIRPQGGMTTETLHYMNVLYLSGRQFQMKSRSAHAAYQISAETILSQYPIYFQIFGVDEERSITFLRKYLAENAVDGMLNEESQMNLSMLYWNAK